MNKHFILWFRGLVRYLSSGS